MISRSGNRVILPVMLAVLGVVGAREASAQRNRDRVIPADTVVRVELRDKLSTQTAQVGQRFVVDVDAEDRSGFPDGTRFEGVVSESRRPTKDRPGIMDMDFRTAILPDGRRVAINGTLASLDEDQIRTTEEGRIESRQGGGKLDTKWIGYGAAAGAVLGGILGDDWLKGGLLGGLGGAAYGYLNRNKRGGYKDVALDSGTDFGVRLTQRVAFADRPNYRYGDYASRYDTDRTARSDRYADTTYRDRTDRIDRTDRTNRYDRYDSTDRVAGARQERRYNQMPVYVNGRQVSFGATRPTRLNGELFVPLAPIARAANMSFDHRSGSETFTLYTDDGAVRGTVGESSVLMRGGRTMNLQTAPLSVNGDIYVSAEYLSRVMGMTVNWDRNSEQMRLDLETR